MKKKIFNLRNYKAYDRNLPKQQIPNQIIHGYCATTRHISRLEQFRAQVKRFRKYLFNNDFTILNEEHKSNGDFIISYK